MQSKFWTTMTMLSYICTGALEPTPCCPAAALGQWTLQMECCVTNNIDGLYIWHMYDICMCWLRTWFVNLLFLVRMPSGNEFKSCRAMSCQIISCLRDVVSCHDVCCENYSCACLQHYALVTRMNKNMFWHAFQFWYFVAKSTSCEICMCRMFFNEGVHWSGQTRKHWPKQIWRL